MGGIESSSERRSESAQKPIKRLYHSKSMTNLQAAAIAFAA
jgi:hypothetical protein